jgi:hypothetical protein
VGEIVVHEFITLDGVFESPTWRFDYPFDPEMGQAIGGLTGSSEVILLGCNTFEQFAPAGSEPDSGSGRLAGAMLADGLVDQLHLFVFP